MSCDNVIAHQEDNMLSFMNQTGRAKVENRAKLNELIEVFSDIKRRQEELYRQQNTIIQMLNKLQRILNRALFE